MKIKQILRLSVLFFCFYILFTPVQAADETVYYIDISLFPESYAEFEITVKNYNFDGNEVIELPILKCEDNLNKTSDVFKKIRVSDISDFQTLEGAIDLNKSCMGVTIERPDGKPKNFTISFIYENTDWEVNNENYPQDNYKMPILISFPEIKSDDSVSVYTRIRLPPNTELTNNSTFKYWEHPFTTQQSGHVIDNKIYNYGGEQILESDTFFNKNHSPQAIYIPLEFKRKGFLSDFSLDFSLDFFTISIILLSFIFLLLSCLIFKGNDVKVEILTIAILLFSYYQFFASDKPIGITTRLDLVFIGFSVVTLFLFSINLIMMNIPQTIRQRIKNVFNPNYYEYLRF